MNRPLVAEPTRRPVLVAAVVTLAVTLLRLLGEVERWSPRLFNREGGGAGALVGIVWLVPIFGVWFGLRLSRAGLGPASRRRALVHAVVGLLVMFGGFTVVGTAGKTLSPSVLIVVVNLAAIVAGVLAYRGWRDLGRTLLVYGYAARIPVALLMLVAMSRGWGTHYEVGMPGLPEMSLLPKWIVIGALPQLLTWISFTVVVGTLFGTVATFFSRREPVAQPFASAAAS